MSTTQNIPPTITNNNKANNPINQTSGAAAGSHPTAAYSTNNPQTSNLLSNIERANFKDSIMIHVIDDSKNEKRDF